MLVSSESISAWLHGDTSTSHIHLHLTNNGASPVVTYLSPHFFYVLQDHVAMPVKSLNAPKQFAVVPAVDEDLTETSLA